MEVTSIEGKVQFSLACKHTFVTTLFRQFAATYVFMVKVRAVDVEIFVVIKNFVVTRNHEN